MMTFFLMNAQNIIFFQLPNLKKNIVWMVEVAPAHQVKKG